jgi:hypothetical protein
MMRTHCKQETELAYGTRTAQEAAVVRAVLRAVQNGLPADEIADRLNQKGIPSPGGAKWRGYAVRRILRRQQLNGDLHRTNGDHP